MIKTTYVQHLDDFFASSDDDCAPPKDHPEEEVEEVVELSAWGGCGEEDKNVDTAQGEQISKLIALCIVRSLPFT